MQLRSSIFALSTSAAAVAVMLMAAGPVVAGGHRIPVSQGTEAAGELTPASGAGKGICFNNLSEASQGVVSQNFSDQNALDAQGADDFTLHKRCRVSVVGIDGMVFNGVATSYTVSFYKDKAGHPGRVVATMTSDIVDPCPPRVVCDTAITLPHAVTLKRGGGWVSVQADLDFAEGQFVWLTALTQRGDAALWENPGDGWGTGCTTWTDLQSCWGDGLGADFEFVLLR
jgi:hypothetical protein